MKLLVFSDSHGSIKMMRDAVLREGPDRVLHLGDVARDARELQGRFPGLPLDYVPGNCDGYTREPVEKLLDAQGRKILMTHGHIYGVKSGYDAAIAAAREAGAHILLFGHTHQAFCDHRAGLWVMNPGSCRGWGPASYGVIVLERDDIACYTVDL